MKKILGCLMIIFLLLMTSYPVLANDNKDVSNELTINSKEGLIKEIKLLSRNNNPRDALKMQLLRQ